MVATLAQAASAAYYLESQRSFRHPNEYYTAGEEPDGVWFNPAGLLGLEDGGKVDSGDFHRLYNGFAPDGSARLTRNAGSEQRSAGLDMTFSADKSVSALWAVADPELRSRIERAAQRRRPGGAGRDRVPLLRLYADPGQGGADPGSARRHRGGDVPARHQPGERPAASYPLRDLQRGPHPRGRQVAGHAPVPGLQLGQGRGRGLPQRARLEPPRAPGHPHGAIRSRWRAHPYRGHAGGFARLLVEAAQGDRGQGRRAGHPLSRQRVPAWPASTSSRGRASRTTTTRRYVTGGGGARRRGSASGRR